MASRGVKAEWARARFSSLACGLQPIPKLSTGLPNYRGPKPPGREPILIRGLLGIGLHSRR